MTKPRIAVGVPVRNAVNHFRKMINTVMAHTTDFVLFICDDASMPNTSEFIDTLPAKRVIRHRAQQWFTRSANDLIVAAFLDNVDYLFLLNSDIYVSNKWHYKLLDHFKLDPSIALVGSLYEKGAKNIYVKPPNFITGHCWCLKMEHVAKIGILDERYMHIESDREYCYRLHRHQFKMYMDRTTPIEHKGGASWGHKLAMLNMANLRALPRKRPIHCLSDPKFIRTTRKRYNLHGNDTNNKG
jgi:GT2 family glycosyltransferase